MKLFKILTTTAMVFALSTNFAMAKEAAKDSVNFKVAVVDIQKIVGSSPAINALNLDRKNKIADLGKFIDNARAAVQKETNEAKKKSLEENYNKELNSKKDAIDKEYSKRLVDIDKEVTSIIDTKAQKFSYDLVLTKNSVLRGGTDITAEIIKELK